MALDKKVAENVIRKKQEQQRSELEAKIREALTWVEDTAKCAELALDEKISNGHFALVITSGNIANAYLKHLPLHQKLIHKINNYNYSNLYPRFDFALKYAQEEIITILKKKYLSKGWNKVSVYVSSDDTCSIKLE
jgi:hypothetical protein